MSSAQVSPDPLLLLAKKNMMVDMSIPKIVDTFKLYISD